MKKTIFLLTILISGSVANSQNVGFPIPPPQTATNNSESIHHCNEFSENIRIASGLGHNLLLSEATIEFGQTPGNFSNILSSKWLTGIRNAYLQDKTGTIAYLDDIPAASNDFWKLGGNTGTDPSVNAVGTLDNKSLQFITNGQKSGFIDRTTQGVSFGVQAALNSTGLNTVAIGWRSLYSQTYGSTNVSIGGNTMYFNTYGSANSALGGDALHNNTIGNQNVAIGSSSLYSNQIGEFNTAIGNASLYNNTTGSYNLGLGYWAGKYNTTESDQIFINTRDRLNYDGDIHKSPLYIKEAFDVKDQLILVNGNMTITGTVTENMVYSSTATSMVMSNSYSRFIFSGTATATWTLYPVTVGVNKQIIIHNRGTATILLQTNGGGMNISDQGNNVAIKRIMPGETWSVFNDGTFFITYQ